VTHSLDVPLFTIAFALYIVALLAFLIRSAVRRGPWGWIALAATGLGAVVQTIALIVRWDVSGRPPLSSMYEYASVMSWMAALSLTVLVARTRRFDFGTYAAPLIIALMAIASLLPNKIEEQLVPALQSYWLYIHVSMAAISEGAFVLACALAIAYLIKARRSDARPEELARLDALIHRVIAIGYPLFTLGALFAGAIWAYNAWGTFWSWDPKEVGSLIIWLFYTGYLHARFKRGWSGKRAAWLAVIGFVMIILSFVGNLFLGGQHSYG
jgi:cytochrome c-type biogenesis protein CcsB